MINRRQYNCTVKHRYVANQCQLLSHFSEKNRFFRTFKVHFRLLPVIFRSLFFKSWELKVSKVFTAKNNHRSDFFLTLSNFKNHHFLLVSGYVLKMALAIYMRGDKKSWKKKEMRSMKIVQKTFLFDSGPRENIVLCVYIVFKTLLSTSVNKNTYF